MKKRTKTNIILAICVILLVLIPFIFVKGEYGGSDDQGTEHIKHGRILSGLRHREKSKVCCLLCKVHWGQELFVILLGLLMVKRKLNKIKPNRL